MEIKIYVCPTEGCPDYVGYGGMPPLEGPSAAGRGGNQVARGQNFENRSESAHHTRADCPTCRQRGLGRVQRVPLTFELKRPAPIELVPLTHSA